MENSKLNRINELARLAKERELTPEELQRAGRAAEGIHRRMAARRRAGAGEHLYRHARRKEAEASEESLSVCFSDGMRGEFRK